MCLTSVLALSCSDESESAGGTPFAIASSELERNSNPDVPDADFAKLIEDNGQFALDLYTQLKDEQEGNFFYSPHSISIALAMTYAGAKGNTRTEMGNTLHFTLEEETLHSAFNKLDLTLSSPEPADNSATDTNRDTDTGTEKKDFVFRTANSLWAEQTYTFMDSFLDPLALHYGAGVNLMDFFNRPEEARQTINAWVEEQTNEKIIELLPEGTIDYQTRFVLTNAVYFYGKWMYPFYENATTEREFTLLDGTPVSIPTMTSKKELFPYLDGEGYVAVQLPYVAEQIDPSYPSEPIAYEKAGMLIIMPDAGGFEAFESQFDMQALSNIEAGLQPANMFLHVPKWKFRSEFQMKATLQAMGIADAFIDGVADFSGMDGSRSLSIGKVIHQAFVAVDEEGTEAAAATAVTVNYTDADITVPFVVRINRPFIFLIRDLETGAILFVGRVLNPNA
jgi:serpin B